ncbi:EF-hand domain-containing protein [Xanthomonas euvesicatoria pv. euvesicatoria]
MSTISSVGAGYAAYTSYASRSATTGNAASAAQAEKTNPLTQLFKSIDSDSDGSLTASELSTALSSNSNDDSKIDIDGLLSMLDQDGGGTVS